MLEEYKKKRDFLKTPEPKKGTKKDVQSNAGPKEAPGIYVIQRHSARRLHYDFRVENEGVLKSWAVPKGLSSDPSERRLAVQTEDHPMEYSKFEGDIPKGEYGAGKVEIWDEGKFVNITIKDGKVRPLKEAIEKGHFIIYIKGRKLDGTYAFTRMDKENWIIVKKKEPRPMQQDYSVSGHDIRVTNPQKELDTGIRKIELVEYYSNIAGIMLPHVRERLISMYRFPGGVSGKKFFQKNAPDYFPDWMPTKCVKDSKDSTTKDNRKQTCYTTVKDEAGIIYLANQVVEPHITVSRLSGIPDKMIFDLDPSKDDMKELRDAALMLKDFLSSIGLNPFIMTSGGKGFHINVPIKMELDNDAVRAFALKIAETMVKSSSSLTTELLKSKRAGRIFVDVNRISEHQTAIAPYGARARPRLPIACPFEWDELPNVTPNHFTIRNYPKEDAWKDFYKKAVSLDRVIKRLKS